MTSEKDKNNHRESLTYEAIFILVVKEDFYNFNLLLILWNGVYFLNPFHATGLFRYPLKISENLWFSDVFREYRKRPVA